MLGYFALLRAYMVCFAHKDAALDEPAKAKIALVAQEAAARHFYHLTIFGHTDTIGSEDFNKPLSIDRANNVQQELEKDLIGLGVPSELIKITVEAKWFRDPLRDGGPDLRDPRNRRVVIQYDQ